MDLPVPVAHEWAVLQLRKTKILDPLVYLTMGSLRRPGTCERRYRGILRDLETR